MNDIDSQTKGILAFLKRGGKITPLSALRLFGCLRLSARIYDLKGLGHEIAMRRVEVGHGKRVAEYSLQRKRRKA